MKSNTLSNKVILITGASTGIGSALAEILATQYQNINLILAARNQEKLEIVANKCREAKAKVLIVPTDLSKTEEVLKLAKKSLSEFDRIDILVNNAGYGQMGALELIPPEAAKEQFAVNFHAPLLLTQSLIPKMREQGGGKIFNISSLGGLIPFPAAGMYSCSKFALEAMSDVLRMELGAFNIKVTVVEPGPVITDFFKVAWDKVLEYIPHYAKTKYAPIFDNIEAIDRQLNLLGWSSEKTAKAIAKEMNKTNPRPRYILATGGNVLVFLMNKVFPLWLRDAFWKRLYAVDKIQN